VSKDILACGFDRLRIQVVSPDFLLYSFAPVVILISQIRKKNLSPRSYHYPSPLHGFLLSR
jgi:hypothetical protein